MKIDLNELERVAKAAAADEFGWWDLESAFLLDAGVGSVDVAHISAAGPITVLALIARIRELESAAVACVYSLGAIEHHEAVIDLRALVAKGITR